MQKDIYAIYEAYIVEGQGPYAQSSVQMPGARPRVGSDPTNGGGNNDISPTTAAGARLPINDLGGGTPTARDQAEETITKEHRTLELKIKKLIELCHRADYEGIIIDCMNISALANAAKKAKEKKK